jgi:hypothetical protein
MLTWVRASILCRIWSVEWLHCLNRTTKWRRVVSFKHCGSQPAHWVGGCEEVPRIGVVLVMAIPIRYKVRGFKPGRGRWIFKGDKLRSTTCLGGEVMPSARCRKTSRHVKDRCRVWLRYLVGKIHDISRQVPSCFATRCLWCNQRALVDESGIIITQTGTHSRSEMVTVLG